MAQTDENTQDIEQERRHKRVMARSVVAAFAATSAAVTTLPLPFKDAVMLSPIELAEINALADVYDIPQDDDAYRLLETSVGLGLASMAARQAIAVLERRPRLRLSAGAKSALIAAGIVAAIGIATSITFDRIHKGEIALDDVDFGAKLRKPETLQRLAERASAAVESVLGEAAADGLRTSFHEMLKAFVSEAA